MRVLVNDVNMNVETVGSGSPLVLLHGFTGSVSSWQPFLSSWRKYFQVIAIDIIGHGKTDAPQNMEHYRMDQAATDLIALLDELHVDRANILGYSMGGRLALTMAVRYPDRVSKLMLESSSPGLITDQERKERIKRDEALADRIERDGVAAFSAEWGKLPLFSTQRAADREQLHRQRLNNRPHGLANSLRGMGTGAQTPLWDQLPAMEVPVWLLVGERDEKFCRIAKEMDEVLPESEVLVVSEAGHAIHVEQPRIFDTIVIKSFK